ncbi:hypothetical protein HELRODRAFT_180740 [Helobdella robusta]|uniref:Apple domain-containing protein n=1 Tax=Helobdella robusta TaxID=6412 RepID=T1FG81_HELRO|nr:hypothetical protein HELRODRAFT_180740 [Helobdella robusta]ESN93649.1 hypothetical protein HELRODRAFT_180740 [Helobdella robusta]
MNEEKVVIGRSPLKNNAEMMASVKVLLCVGCLLVAHVTSNNAALDCPAWEQKSHYNSDHGENLPNIRTLDESVTSTTNTATVGTMPPSATTRAPCSSFSMALSNNSNIPGSVRQGGFTSLNDCLNACQKTAWCTGIDWNTLVTADQQCWFSYTSSSNINLNGYIGVYHYHLTCTASNANTPAPNPVTQGSGCQWKLTVNTNTANGIVQNSANTLPDCQAACYAYSSSNKCALGFDWSPSNGPGSMCYISTSPTLNSGAVGVSHYSIDCGGQWNVTVNSNSPNGIFMSQYQTLDACKAACVANLTACSYGIDWNNANKQCFFSTSSTLNVNGFPGVDHHTYVALCTWSTTADTNSPGGEVRAAATTLDACKKICTDLGTSGCPYGVDWNPSASPGTQCFLSKTSVKSSYIGVSHHDVTCVNTTGCIWSLVANTNSPGGMAQPGATTVDACQAQCIANKENTCKYGIDFNPSNPTGLQCFFATSQATSTAAGVTHYTYQCSSSVGGLTTSPSWCSTADYFH